MSTSEDHGRRVTPGTELLTLRAENERLKAYLGRVLEVLEARVDELGPGTDPDGSFDDIEVIDDGVPVEPGPRSRAGAKGLMVIGDDSAVVLTDGAEQGEAMVDVAERLATVQQDLARVEAHVETLLWRLGERRSTYAAGS